MQTPPPASTAKKLQAVSAASLALYWANAVPLCLNSFCYIYHHNQVVFGFSTSSHWPTVLALTRQINHQILSPSLAFTLDSLAVISWEGEGEGGGVKLKTDSKLFAKASPHFLWQKAL